MSVDLSELSLLRARQDMNGALAATGDSDTADTLKFQTLLASRLGIDGQVLGSGEAFAGGNVFQDLSQFGFGGASGQNADPLGLAGLMDSDSLESPLGGMNMLTYNALHTLAKLAETTDAASSAASGQESAASTGSSQVRMEVVKNAVRMAVNPGARHPDDLGHLAKTIQGTEAGFTKGEEELLLAAATAESRLERSMLAEEAAEQSQSGKVLASSLERSAGKLSSQYESGGAIDCIGYDRKGGTSYGQYQIASKTGTMDNFLKFLDEKAPDISEKLRDSGPADTGGRTGRMPDTWKRIASEDSTRFEALQHEFIRSNNYSPAAKSIVLTSGVDVNSRSHALREVLWSTAVQHGPSGAERIFSKAIETVQDSQSGQDFDKAVIEEVYSIRQRQFGGHGKRVRDAVQARFKDEKNTAIALLDQTSA
ncbi:MAG: hypothetical protein ACOY4F_03675 [Thermodesulfobacteriota bacterium]